MKVFFPVSLLCLLSAAHEGFCQTPRWLNFNSSNSPLPSNRITAITQADDGAYWMAVGPRYVNQTWIGGGLVRFDGNAWTVFDTTNSPLPSNFVTHVVFDAFGNLWVATVYGGALKYDGVNWQIFNAANTGVPCDDVWRIAVEKNGTAWLGTFNDGVMRYDGTTWTQYDDDNSGLTTNLVGFIVIDEANTKWVGTDYGVLASFDDREWKQHLFTNFLHPPLNNFPIALVIDRENYKWIAENRVLGKDRIGKYRDSSLTIFDSAAVGLQISGLNYDGIAIDQNNIKWIACHNGLLKYDDVTWRLFSSSNEPIPANKFWGVMIDSYGNKVLNSDDESAYPGVVFFNESGVQGPVASSVQEDEPQPSNYVLLQSRPNPFHEATAVTFQVQRTGLATLKLFDVQGREIATLFHAFAESRQTYHAALRARELAHGIYFLRLQAGSRIATSKILCLKK